jgi:DNA-binding NarL/FixJ family response regulator
MLRSIEPAHGRVSAASLHPSYRPASAPIFMLASMRGRVQVRDSVLVRCLIVDDNPEFLDAATRLLEGQGMRIVGVASSGAEAVVQAQALRPAVVLVDVKLGDENGFDVVRQLAGPVILISTYAERDFADPIAESPALGFLSKSRLSASAIEKLVASASPGT